MNKGFTLVEVLIALSIAIVAASYTAQVIASTNKVTLAGRQKFIATNLAQEGLELTRKARDNAWLQDETPDDPSDWMSSIFLCPEQNGVTKYTITDEGDIAFGDAGTIELPDDPIVYTRELTATCDHAVAGEDAEDAREFVEIASTVSWIGNGGDEQRVTLRETLYNWYPYDTED